MFDKYMICETDVRNLESGGQATGFEFGARLPYYRGIGLSMVERIGVKLDGAEIDGGRIRLRLRERTYSLSEMEMVYDEAWNMGEVAHVQVELPGGLPPGPHTVELTEQLRISYLPFPLIGKDSKTVSVGG